MAPLADVAAVVMLAGHEIVGFIVSRTVTVCWPVAVFPWASVTDQVIVVVPFG